MKRWVKGTLLGCGLLLLACVSGMFLMVFLFHLLVPNPFDDRPFDREVWLAEAGLPGPDNPRGQMYEDLLEKHLKKGMTKAEVLALLGKPDATSRSRLFSYELGMWSGMRIDTDTLDVEFDGTDKVKRAYRVQH